MRIPARRPARSIGLSSSVESTLVPAFAFVLVFALALAFASSGQGQISPQTQTAGGAPGGTPSPLGSEPCPKLSEAIAKATSPDRAALCRSALHQPCRPMPAVIWNAIHDGKWSDGEALPTGERANLLAVAVDGRYAEAESLTVLTLQEGGWPGGVPISMEDGATLIRGLKPALNPYRVHLLLDIYEQQDVSVVRIAVLQTLKASLLDEALLPALECYYEADGPIQQAGLANLKGQPEKTPAEILARIISQLPAGTLLKWADRLGERHPSDAVKAARKARGFGSEGRNK
jgi:hypothetical protein